MTSLSHPMKMIDTLWFQNALRDRKITQRQLAARLGIDAAAVSLMLNGKRKMSAREAADLSSILNLSVDLVMSKAGVGPKVNGTEKTCLILSLPVPLADGDMAVLQLPQDLSEEEAERICIMVRAFVVMHKNRDVD